MEMLIQEMLETQRQMQQDIRQIELHLAEKRGERRIGLWIAGASGTAASALLGLLFQSVKAFLGKHG